MTELEVNVVEFLNSEIAPIVYGGLLKSFYKEIYTKPEVCAVSDKKFSDVAGDILKDFEVDIVAGNVDKNIYMEAEVDENCFYINSDWLLYIKTLNMNSREYKQHRFLLFIKALHEVAHLLTPLFWQWCKDNSPSYPASKKAKKENVTPIKVGQLNKAKGDAGFGLEEILLGGRMYHLGYKKDKWRIYKLLIRKKVGRTIKSFEVGRGYMQRKFDSIEKYMVTCGDEIKSKELPDEIRKLASVCPNDDFCIKRAHSGLDFDMHHCHPSDRRR